MLKSKDAKYGNLSATILDFEEAGDKLPMHSHDEASVHISIVARGSIRATGDGWSRNLKSGAVVDFVAGQEHEFVALEANTRLVNIVKGVAA